MCAGWTLCEFPFVAEQGFEITVIPSCWRGCPRAFKSTGNCAAAAACAETILPTQTHFLNRRGLWLWTNILIWIRCAVCLSKCVPARNERDSFLIVHCHARECFANVVCRSQWIGCSVWTLGVDINQSHLHCGKRICKFALTRISLFCKPFLLAAPICFIRLPHILTATAKSKCFKSHGFQRNIAGENDQISPRNLFAILLLDGPHQAPRFVQIDIVGPTI